MEAAALTRPLGHVLFTSRACCPVSPATPLCWPAPFPRVSLCPRRRPRCCPFSSTNSSTARSPWALLPRTLRWVLGTKLLFFVVLLLFSVLVFRASTVLLCSLTLLPLVCCRCPLLCGCMQVIFDSGAWEVRGWRLASCLHAAGCGGGVGARLSGADCLLPVPCARLLQPVGRLREVRGAGVPVQAPLRLLQEVRHRAGGVLLWNLTAPTHLFAPPFFFFGPFLFPAAPRTSPTASPSTSPMPLAP
jgi:hypothetical protein